MTDAFVPQSDPTVTPQPAEVFGAVPQVTEPFRTVPQGSESFGNVPKDAAPFRTVPNVSESFRTVPQPSVRRENCTLTVREVARMFEAAGVARSERSITNWCQPNRQGIARLEAYFDPNERRYFITPQSVDAVIQEEKAKAAKANAEPLPQPSEPFRTVPPDAESFRTTLNASEPARDRHPDDADDRELAELKKANTDLSITNRAKDYFIEQLKTEREHLTKQLVETSRQVGQLETKLLQIEGPEPEARV